MSDGAVRRQEEANPPFTEGEAQQVTDWMAKQVARGKTVPVSDAKSRDICDAVACWFFEASCHAKRVFLCLRVSTPVLCLHLVCICVCICMCVCSVCVRTQNTHTQKHTDVDTRGSRLNADTNRCRHTQA